MSSDNSIDSLSEYSSSSKSSESSVVSSVMLLSVDFKYSKTSPAVGSSLAFERATAAFCWVIMSFSESCSIK